MLAYTKWDGYFHNLYIADPSTRQEQLVLTHASGPSFSADGQKLFFIGEQGVDQQSREDWVACSFGTISEGVVAVDLTNPVKLDFIRCSDCGSVASKPKQAVVEQVPLRKTYITSEIMKLGTVSG